MTLRRAQRAFVLVAMLGVVPAMLRGQQAAVERRTPFTLDLSTFYHSLDNGYSDWQGVDARLAYAGTQFSPFASASTQHRREGSQSSYGLGSYVTLGPHAYSIVGFSVATGGTTVLYPRLRWDASLIADTRVVPGLLLATGFTRVSFGGGSTGWIASAGPIYYHGPLILTGAMHLNHDDVGGVSTGSGEAGAQYGSQGRYWVGGNISAGHEAYEILAATPLNAQFTNLGASAFVQRWVTHKTAVMVRAEYQDKRTAYHRIGLVASYEVAF